VRGKARKARDFAVTGCMKYAAVRNHDWLYITEAPDGSPALYDLKRDPAEQKNLFKRRKRKAGEMEDLLKGYVEEHS